jgi:outer membrane protein OmpA-like peptidoglycan-associated protein
LNLKDRVGKRKYYLQFKSFVIPEHQTINTKNSNSPASQSKDASAAQDLFIHEPVREKLQSITLQRKLSVGAPDDPLEHEADSMADTVMRMAEPNFIQRKCAHCEEEEKAQRKPLSSFIQRKESSGAMAVTNDVTNQLHSNKGNGVRMDTNTRSFMESRFGADFSSVNIHTNNEAIQMSRDLNAKAFTVGSDIYFNEGHYQPGTDGGRHLLAHELTHTLQQAPTIQRQSAPGQPLPTGTYPDIHLDQHTAEITVTRAQEAVADFTASVGVDEPVSLIPPALGVPSNLPDAILTVRVSYDDRCNRTVQGADLHFNQQLTDPSGFPRDPLRTVGAGLGLRFGGLRADGNLDASFDSTGLQGVSFSLTFRSVSTAIPDECRHTPPPPGTGGGGDNDTPSICGGIDCTRPRQGQNMARYLLCCIGTIPPTTPQLNPRTIYFYYDTPVFKPGSMDSMQLVLDTMRILPSVIIWITGHTSLEGTDRYNQSLSERRANAVKDYLVMQRIDASRITAVGVGESTPAVAEPPEPRPRSLRLPQGEAIRDLNRRAEIVFFDTSGRFPSAPLTLSTPDLSLRRPGLGGTARLLQSPTLRWGSEE